MVIEKNGKVYTVIESSTKWTVKNENGKLSVAFDIAKELCPTDDDLRKYVLNEDSKLF